jgi:hypothetical protein
MQFQNINSFIISLLLKVIKEYFNRSVNSDRDSGPEYRKIII